MLGLVDFPLLLSIKMKFLFEAAAVYGFDTNEYEERCSFYMCSSLHFQVRKQGKRHYLLLRIGKYRNYLIADMDWRDFQQEYRDYIDLVKMFQLIPGFGAIVGAFANYNLLDQLGEAAMNSYRLRLMQRISDTEKT